MKFYILALILFLVLSVRKALSAYPPLPAKGGEIETMVTVVCSFDDRFISDYRISTSTDYIMYTNSISSKYFAESSYTDSIRITSISFNGLSEGSVVANMKIGLASKDKLSETTVNSKLRLLTFYAFGTKATLKSTQIMTQAYHFTITTTFTMNDDFNTNYYNRASSRFSAYTNNLELTFTPIFNARTSMYLTNFYVISLSPGSVVVRLTLTANSTSELSGDMIIRQTNNAIYSAFSVYASISLDQATTTTTWPNIYPPNSYSGDNNISSGLIYAVVFGVMAGAGVYVGIIMAIFSAWDYRRIIKGHNPQ